MKLIAMRCTREQYESIKEFIGELNQKDKRDFNEYPYLLNDEDGFFAFNKCFADRKVYENFDKDIFLEACGINKHKFLFEKIKNHFKDAEQCISLFGTKFNMKDLDLDNLMIEDEFVYIKDGNFAIFNLNSGEYAKIIPSLKKETIRKLTEPKNKAEFKEGDILKLENSLLIFKIVKFKDWDNIRAFGFETTGEFCKDDGKFSWGSKGCVKASKKEWIESLERQLLK